MSNESARADGEWLRLERRRYLSYLVRIWQRQSPEHGEWLASAESVSTHERHSFGDLPSLYAFLDAQTQPVDSDDEK